MLYQVISYPTFHSPLVTKCCCQNTFSEGCKRYKVQVDSLKSKLLNLMWWVNLHNVMVKVSTAWMGSLKR